MYADDREIVKITRNAIWLKMDGVVQKYCLEPATPSTPVPTQKKKKSKPSRNDSNLMEAGASGSQDAQTQAVNRTEILSLRECRVVLHKLSDEEIARKIAKIKSNGTGVDTTSKTRDAISHADMGILIGHFGSLSLNETSDKPSSIIAKSESTDVLIPLLDRIKIHSYESSVLSTELNGLLHFVPSNHISAGFKRNVEMALSMENRAQYQINSTFDRIGSWAHGNLNCENIAALLLQFGCNVEIVPTINTSGTREIEAIFSLAQPWNRVNEIPKIASNATRQIENLGGSPIDIVKTMLRLANSIEIVSTIDSYGARKIEVKVKCLEPLQRVSRKETSSQLAIEYNENVSIHGDAGIVEINGEKFKHDDSDDGDDDNDEDDNSNDGYTASDEVRNFTAYTYNYNENT